MYTPHETENYENYVKSEFLRQCGDFYTEKPIKIEIKCYFEPNQAIKKKHDKGKPYPLCDKHKDLDNICKIIMDALNKVAYLDDKQCIELHATKEYGEQEKVWVEILEI